ncbi:hypothetical protein ACHAW6_007863 [Cyclotella cf. meneghiniana]
MKTISLTVVATALASTAAFQSPTQIARPSSALHEYIPSGFTKDSWAAFKAKEKKQKEELMKKNLGRVGPKGFQSRSFQSFQEALERGEAAHMMPVEFAKEKLARGEIKLEDIPYMQRGGSWDNSDVKGARKVRWLQSDKEYANGGFRKSQSVSILGEGAGLDWTGKRDRQGPSVVTAGKMNKNYKAPTVAQMKGKTEQAPKKKGWFGL